MSKVFWPFDAGPGSAITESQWRKMARYWLGTGYIWVGTSVELAVSQRGTGANMSVDVAAGAAFIQGHYFESTAVDNQPITANVSGNPRIDRVVVQADFVANTIDFAVLAGTPAGSPVAPALTQDISTKWEISLAQIAVASGASSIITANITDERLMALALPGAPKSTVVINGTTGPTWLASATTVVTWTSQLGTAVNPDMMLKAGSSTVLKCMRGGVYRLALNVSQLTVVGMSGPVYLNWRIKRNGVTNATLLGRTEMSSSPLLSSPSVRLDKSMSLLVGDEIELEADVSSGCTSVNASDTGAGGTGVTRMCMQLEAMLIAP